jgi:hypothetical protein
MRDDSDFRPTNETGNLMKFFFKKKIKLFFVRGQPQLVYIPGANNRHTNNFLMLAGLSRTKP